MSSHMIRGRQLSRDTEHRKALRRNLVQSLFEHGKIRTTLPKAKEVKAFAEKLITLARTEHAQRPPPRHLAAARPPAGRRGPGIHRARRVVQKLFNESRPKFADRSGGYTRIIKTQPTTASATAATWCCSAADRRIQAAQGHRPPQRRPPPQAQRAPPPVRRQHRKGARRSKTEAAAAAKPEAAARRP